MLRKVSVTLPGPLADFEKSRVMIREPSITRLPTSSEGSFVAVYMVLAFRERVDV